MHIPYELDLPTVNLILEGLDTLPHGRVAGVYQQILMRAQAYQRQLAEQQRVQQELAAQQAEAIVPAAAVPAVRRLRKQARG